MPKATALKTSIAALIAFISIPTAGAQHTSAMVRPLMGWSSWNTFECKIDETLIKQTAASMVDRGFVAAGYDHLNIDDCWAAKTREDGVPGSNRLGAIRWETSQFPSGPDIAKDIHGRGMKFGIYSSAGSGTCAARTGSLWYEDLDVAKFAEWGVDYVKYDNCDQPTPDGWAFPHPDNNGAPPQERFGRMGAQLANRTNSQGRPIAYGMCAWGFYQEWNWASETVKANAWRIQEDIGFCWDYPCWKMPILGVWDRLASLPNQGADLAGPTRGWNDLDMLAVGVPSSSLSLTEEKSHFTMWAVAKSPLVLGCDVRNVDDSKRALLTNGEVIAINQDSLGQPARRVGKDGDIEIWAGALAGNQAVAMLFNRAGETRTITLDFAAHLSSIPSFAPTGDNSYALRDLWDHKELGVVKGTYAANVESHGVVLLRIRAPDSGAVVPTASATVPPAPATTTTVKPAATTTATAAATTQQPPSSKVSSAATTTSSAAPTGTLNVVSPVKPASTTSVIPSSGEKNKAIAGLAGLALAVAAGL